MERLNEIALRKAEIKELLKSDESVNLEEIKAELDQLEAEEKSINEEIEAEQRKADEEAEERRQIAEKMEEKKPVDVKEINLKENKMENIEVRNTKEYINAYAEYIKSGKDDECRALLTENVSGMIPVPEFVYDIVKNAWDREGIMSLVRKSYLKGNLKVGFEISGSDATNHIEGGDPVSEETLIEGVVQMNAISVKKWVSISDEVYDLRGESFLQYIYDELAYRIAKKCADNLIAAIEACDTVSTTTMVGVPVITAASIGLGTVAAAMAELSDNAANPVIMMNKKTWGAFKAVQYAANYAVDPFENLRVLFNNSITAYSAATTGVTYAIVGDLGEGALANYPNGSEIDFKFDEMSKKKEDLIEVLGRQFVAVAPIAPNHFVKIQK